MESKALGKRYALQELKVVWGLKTLWCGTRQLMVRHLWDLARKKDTMWVKWCHTFMIKGKHLWTGSFHGDMSWTWRKLL